MLQKVIRYSRSEEGIMGKIWPNCYGVKRESDNVLIRTERRKGGRWFGEELYHR